MGESSWLLMFFPGVGALLKLITVETVKEADSTVEVNNTVANSSVKAN